MPPPFAPARRGYDFHLLCSMSFSCTCCFRHIIYRIYRIGRSDNETLRGAPFRTPTQTSDSSNHVNPVNHVSKNPPRCFVCPSKILLVPGLLVFDCLVLFSFHYRIFFPLVLSSHLSLPMLYLARFWMIVSQLSPHCSTSYIRYSKSLRSFRHGVPHSLSWYARSRSFNSKYGQRISFIVLF